MRAGMMPRCGGAAGVVRLGAGRVHVREGRLSRVVVCTGVGDLGGCDWLGLDMVWRSSGDNCVVLDLDRGWET